MTKYRVSLNEQKTDILLFPILKEEQQPNDLTIADVDAPDQTSAWNQFFETSSVLKVIEQQNKIIEQEHPRYMEVVRSTMALPAQPGIELVATLAKKYLCAVAKKNVLQHLTA